MKLLPFVSCLLLPTAIQGTDDNDLVFSEEFDYTNGGRPDPSIWTYDLGDWGWGNAELQRYTNLPQNVHISQDGKLVIRAIRIGNSFTSGRIKTLNKLTFKYGQVEASIKMPDLGNGLWPAFWTLGNNFPVIGWPACGEMDIMEMGHSSGINDGVINRRVGSAAHWEHGPGQYANYGKYFDLPEDLTLGFHKYRLEWTPYVIRTFVDNYIVWEMDISESQCPMEKCSEFHKHHFFLLNMAVGGRYTGLLNPAQISASFPAEYEIDYIRVYKNEWTTLGGSYVSDAPQEQLSDCGCPATCTSSILDLLAKDSAGTFTCRERMQWVMSNLEYSQVEACSFVSDEFPTICGAGCDPSNCVATMKPSPPPTTAPIIDHDINCGCPKDCNDSSLGQMADGFSCGDRIKWLMRSQSKTEAEACSIVSEEFPDICGAKCNPETCDFVEDTDQKVSCGCTDCDESVLNRMADGHTCKARIVWVMDKLSKTEEEACALVSDQFPAICGQGCNPETCQATDCFCDGYCDDSTLNKMVTDISGTYSCKDRIQYTRNKANVGLEEACIRVSEEFPSVCGQGCHPKNCEKPPTPVVVDCGCPESCNTDVLNRLATDGSGTYTCASRIDWVMGYYGLSEENACAMVSGEFPSICGQGCDCSNSLETDNRDGTENEDNDNTETSTPSPTMKQKKAKKKKKD